MSDMVLRLNRHHRKRIHEIALRLCAGLRPDFFEAEEFDLKPTEVLTDERIRRAATILRRENDGRAGKRDKEKDIQG